MPGSSRLISFFAVLVLTSGIVNATEWVHQKGNEDPFKGGSEHIVMGIDLPGVMIGLRCAKGADLTMMFVVAEKPNPEHVKFLSLASFQMLAIIDDEPKTSLDAEIEITPDGDRYRLSAKGPEVKDIVHKIASARKRVALAGEVGGKIIWSHAFSTGGSRRALQPLISGCGL